MTARNIMRELQGLDARLDRDGNRLILRAGRYPVPHHLVEQAREAKRELLTLLGGGGALRIPNQQADLPTSPKPVSTLGEFLSESRGNAGDSLRCSNEHLSEHLSSSNEHLSERVLEESEDFCGPSGEERQFNHEVCEQDSPDLPKVLTPPGNVSILANAQDLCGVQGLVPLKVLTPSCRKSLSYDASQQNASGGAPYKSVGCKTVGYPTCCECGLPIDERLQTSWGGKPCHRACGEAAWRRELLTEFGHQGVPDSPIS
jgi:hypothetical protein